MISPSVGFAAVSLAVVVACGCDTPSSHVDAGDLQGVFDDAGKAAPTSSASGSARAAASASAPVREREASGPRCVREQGEPETLQRTIGRPACRAAEVLEWRDPSGSPRYACLFTPSDMAKRSGLPLLVYFHGSSPGLDDPTSMSKLTSLRAKMDAFDMTGDPERKGFMILGIQGRAVGKTQGLSGASFDTTHVSEDNLDKVATDHFVDAILSRGQVDPKRIYAFGMGKGAEMAASYAMLRADRVAAFFGYAPSVPGADWQCPGPPPPGFVMYRACDTIVPCDTIESWLRRREGAKAETKAFRLGEADREEPNCTPKNRCARKKGEAHHYRWPKGREKDLLQFFAGHALK